MNNNTLYTGSSLLIHFTAKDKDGSELDISAYSKKAVFRSSGRVRIEAEIKEVSNSSFEILLSGEDTKQLGSGMLTLVLSLKDGADERTVRACIVQLANPERQSCTPLTDTGSIDQTITIENPQEEQSWNS